MRSIVNPLLLATLERHCAPILSPSSSASLVSCIVTNYFMKNIPRPCALLVCCALFGGALVPAAHANVLGQISDSLSSLWQNKAQKQRAAQAALSQARAKKQHAEFLHDRLEKTARLLDRANADYENYAGQLKRTEAQIVETRHRVQIATARYERHKKQFGARLAALQKHGKPQMLSVILGSNSLSDLTRRTNFVRALSDHDSGLQTDLKADRLEMTRAQNELMAQWGQRDRLARAAHGERARIVQGQKSQLATWKQINNSKMALLQMATAQQRASDSIGTQINSLEARKAQIIAAYEARAARQRAAQRAAARAQNRVRIASYAPASGGHYQGRRSHSRRLGVSGARADFVAFWPAFSPGIEAHQTAHR